MKKFYALMIILMAGLFVLSSNSHAENIAVYNFLTESKQGKSGTIVVGDNSGGAGYSYKLDIPQGRNGLAPSLSLVYNNLNGNNDNIFGYGWDLTAGYIVRDAKEGVNNLYDKNYFSVNIYGNMKELTPVTLGDGTHGVYGATVEEYWKYVFNNDNSWSVFDKKGTKYTFGSSVLSRQNNPGDSSQIYKWMLEEVRDTNDNFMRYEYFKDQGQIYPKKIVYTGNGATDGPVAVAFEPFFSGPANERSDKYSNYRAKFKTTTRYIADKIKIFVNGEQGGNSVTEYDLNFVNGGNNIRSILQSIQRYGRNSSGVLESLPATTFTYTNRPVSWTENPTWHITGQTFITSSDSGAKDTGIRMADVNGDGLLDIISIFHSSVDGSYSKVVKFNTGSGWGSNNTTWANTLPNKAFNESDDNGSRLADVNGDNLIDLVYSAQGQPKEVYLNTGSGWALNSNWIMTEDFLDYNKKDRGVRLFDINGDGLIDVVRSYSNGAQHSKAVYLNSGSGWNSAPDQFYSDNLPPKAFVYDGYYDSGTRIADVNADGLADIIYGRKYDTHNVYLNTGSGFIEDTTWYQPVDFSTFINNPGNGYHNSGYQFFDVNGDGLVDLVNIQKTFTGFDKFVYLNKGSSFESVSNSTWADSLPNLSFGAEADSGVRLHDVNGDGLDDIVYAEQYQNPQTFLASSDFSDLLNSISESEGKVINYYYKPSTQYKTDGGSLENPLLPFNISTLNQVVENDGLGNQYITTYKYAGGGYYYSASDIWNKRFNGFNLVQKTDPLGNIAKDYYHQGGGVDGSTQGEYQDLFSKMGRLYRSEIYGATGQKQFQTINKWDRSDLGNNRNFVKLIQTVDYFYDGQQAHRDRAKELAYDSYGNLSSEINYGEVNGSDSGAFADIGSDKITTNFYYVADPIKYIISFPYQITKLDNGNAQVWQQKLYYDNLALNYINKGNLTKEERWLNPGNTYVNTQKGYNSYGNIISQTNERNHTTTTQYDTNYFYPVSVTNAKNQSTTVSYSLVYGKILSETDPNGFQTQYIYDTFGRLKEMKVPDLASPSVMRTQTENIYTDTILPRKVQTRKYLDNGIYVDSYIYSDGFGRKVQTREQAETAGQYIAKDFAYNGRNELTKEYLPYFAQGNAYQPANPVNPASNYSYDALGRVTQIQNSVGTTVNSYLPWQVNITDAGGKVKKSYKDAFDRLIKVEEIDGANAYTTQYTYNQADNLIKITDANNNVRNFTYDSLGRKLQAEDLHNSSDITYGVWIYSYDAGGNLTSTLDPKNQTVNYAYDELDRILAEDYVGQTGAEKSYIYDTGINGTGYLSSVATADIAVGYEYNTHGKIKTETKTINSVNYVTGFEYDLQGNQTKITYPDNTDVTYGYNSAGLLESVNKKETGDAAPISVIGNYDYAPNNFASRIDFANNVTTDNTYDSSKLYRLSSKKTYKNTGQGGMLALADITAESAAPSPLKVYRLHELEDGRTSNSKRFLNSDGTVTVEFHSGDIHYKDKNGKWQDIDLSLADDVAGYYKISAHGFESKIPKRADRARKIGMDGKFVSYKPMGAKNAQASPEKEGNKASVARYADVWPSTDLVYKNRWYGLAEDIILKDSAAPTEFSFQLQTDKIRFELLDRELVYKDDAGNQLWKTKKPVAVDAAGKTRDVKISLRKDGKNYFVDLGLDVSDLTYPITIDPTDTFYAGAGDGWAWNYGTNWSSVRNASSGSYATGTDSVGRAGSAKNGSYFYLMRNWLPFDTSALPDSANIVSASLYFVPDSKNDNAIDNPEITLGKSARTAVNIVNYETYNDLNFTEMTSSRLDVTNIMVGSYNSFSLNSAGLGQINKTGFTDLVMLGGDDFDNVEVTGSYDTVVPVFLRSSEYAGTSSDPYLSVTYNVNGTPAAPTYLQTEESANPSDVTDATPEFSSVYNDPDAYDYAKWYQIQVIKESGSFSSPLWDSGKIELSPLLLQGSRSSQISYGGTPLLLDGSRYYLRMKYWDDEGVTGAEGPWSGGADYFTIKDGRSQYQNIDYTYDAVGNITKISNLAGNNSYGIRDYAYDNLHRLVSASLTDSPLGNYTETYSYDPIGNIASKNGQTYTYSQVGKTNPHAVTSIGSTNYTYDDNGNLLTATGGPGNTWDYDNRLTQSVVGANTINYAYDADGDRIKKTTSTGSTIYVNKYYEISPTGKITKYIYDGDEVIATLETQSGTTSVYYTHKDHLGGSSVITDTSGNQTELLDYYPYGSTRLDEKAGAFETSKKYTGKELDQETGLYYYGARYYSPAIGRFVSVDPVYLAMGDEGAIKAITGQKLQQLLSDPQGFNSYAYARNNPLIYIDEDGQFFGQFGIDMSNNQRGVASSFHGFANYAGQFGPLTKGVSFVSNALGDVANTTANIWDSRESGGNRLFAVGMTALDVGSGGKGREINKAAKVINLNGPINITSRGLNHVINNHTLEGLNSAKKSIFNAGENIADLVKQGTQQPMQLQPNRNYQRVFDIGRNIGLDRSTGEQTSKITIITNGLGNLITAHPGLPKFLIK